MSAGTQDINRIFFRDGYRLASSYLNSNFSSGDLYKGIQALYEAIDGLNEALIHRASVEGKPVACRRGCSWCCNQAVFAVTYEFEYLNNYLEKKFDKVRLTKVREKAAHKLEVTSGLSPEKRLLYKAPCPLLENGVCSAYEARPMACRIYLSSDVKSCMREYQKPENTRDFPALFSFPLQAGRIMNEGFTALLRELGYESAEFTMEQGLSTPDNV